MRIIVLPRGRRPVWRELGFVRCHCHSSMNSWRGGFCTLLHSFFLVFKITHEGLRYASSELDAIQLSVFSHRFMSIAEQMGR